MKTIFYLIAALLLPFCALAQTPQAFSYQAIANNTNGTPVAKHTITINMGFNGYGTYTIN